MKQKICGKIKCAVSIIKTTFLLACRNISAASSRVKDGESSYLLVFGFCNVSLWHLKNLISCEWVLSSITIFCSGSLLILPVTARTDDCGPSHVQTLEPRSKQTLVKQHVLGQNNTATFSSHLSGFNEIFLYLILGHMECNSSVVIRLHHY